MCLIFIGNSAYGCTLVNKEKHTDITYHKSTERHFSTMINNKYFRDVEELGDDIVEMEMAKAQIKLQIPIQIGFFVLEYGKLLLLSFYYDFLMKFLSPSSFCLIQSDTDSMYIALSEKSLFLSVYKSKREEFMLQYENWFAKDYCDAHKSDFFECVFGGATWNPGDCCSREAKYDSRTIGKFHTEFEGTCVIALASKTYYCTGATSKHSAKGISRRTNNLDSESYKDVLETATISQAINKGMKVRGDSVYTYKQKRKGLNYMYGKRVVCADRVTTLPTHL